MAVTKKQKVAGALSASTIMLATVFIGHWESGGSMSLVVTQQSIDRKGVYTVCDGVTNLDPDYAWIRPGMKFTPAQCAEAFQKVLPKYIGPLGDCIAGYYTMPPHRQIAFLSAGYNLGTGTICRSTAVRLVNEGKVAQGCEALAAFVKANGKVLKGLQNRRFDPKWGEISWCKRSD